MLVNESSVYPDHIIYGLDGSRSLTDVGGMSGKVVYTHARAYIPFLYINLPELSINGASNINTCMYAYLIILDLSLGLY